MVWKKVNIELAIVIVSWMMLFLSISFRLYWTVVNLNEEI